MSRYQTVAHHTQVERKSRQGWCGDDGYLDSSTAQYLVLGDLYCNRVEKLDEWTLLLAVLGSETLRTVAESGQHQKSGPLDAMYAGTTPINVITPHYSPPVVRQMLFKTTDGISPTLLREHDVGTSSESPH